MNILLYIISSTVEVFLCLLSLAIVLRLFLPFMGLEEGLLYTFAVAVSEPVVAPVRKLISKIEFFESFPMDLSYTFTIVAILAICLCFPTASTFL